MKIIIETNRLYLREFHPVDAESFKKLNDAPDVQGLTGDPPFNTIEDAKQFILNYNHYTEYGFGRWSLIEKSSGKFVGWCGLKFSPELNEVDIGFRIDEDFRGKGFATEAAKASLEYGFGTLELQKIVARCLEQNFASRKVIEKQGMQHYGSREDESGVWLLYQLINV